MIVRGLIWLGTRTDRHEEMVAFAERTLGLRPSEREPGCAAFELPDGSLFEVFGPDHAGGGHPPEGAVAGLEVDDVAGAHEELAAAGVEVSELHAGEAWRWAYFRAPDGNLYEIVGR
jgi:catechol 2,3-dioxygenase-like lactoylglutathione lyase family enzyme